MGVTVRRERTNTITYVANQTVRERINVPTRYLWGLMCRLSGVLTTTVAGTHTITRNPGTLFDLRLMLNNSLQLAAGHGYTWGYERQILNGVITTIASADHAADADAIRLNFFIPCAYPWAQQPWDTVLDFAAEQRLDLHISWQDTGAMIVGGTTSFTTTPTLEITCVGSDDAPPGIVPAQGYLVQRETEVTGLGTTANANLEVPLPYGRDHRYLGLVISSMDVVANSGRELVATELNSVALEMRGAGGHQYGYGPMPGLDVQQLAVHAMRSEDGEQTGVYPIPLLSGPARGKIGSGLSTANASDLRLRIDHDAYSTAGMVLVAYDVYQSRQV